MEDSVNPNGYDANKEGTSWFGETSEAVVKTQRANAQQPISSETVGTQAWLVKIPKFVKEKWDEVGAIPNTDLGVLRVYRQIEGSKGLPKVTLHLPTNPTPGTEYWTDDLPKTYTLNLTNAATANTHVMTTNATQVETLPHTLLHKILTYRHYRIVTAITATVAHEATVTPLIDESYRTLMKKREANEIRKRRNIQKLTISQAKKYLRVRPANVAAAQNSIINASQNAIAAVTGKKNEADKRERMDRADLINSLILLFHQNQFYRMNDLIEQTQQPKAWLKEVLSDVAVLVKKGLYNGMYELKPEYAAAGNDHE